MKMPKSHSFPSGHSAAAFAFATGAGRTLSWTGPPLSLLATLVAYSRIHTGVHYPGDVVIAEAPTYVTALGVFSAYQCEVVHVPP